jgi:hypothetical protein
MLRTFEDNNHDLPSIMPFRSFISAASWAIRSTYHTTGYHDANSMLIDANTADIAEHDTAEALA